MVQLVVGNSGECGAVETHSAHRSPVRVGGDQPGGQKIHHPPLLVDMQNLPHRPLARGDLSARFTGSRIIQVEVSPAVTLGIPEHLAGGQHRDDRWETPELVGFHSRITSFGDHGAYLAGCRVEPAQVQDPQIPGLSQIVDSRFVGAPPRGAGENGRAERGLYRLVVSAYTGSGGDIEHQKFGERHPVVTRVGIPFGSQSRGAAIGRVTLDQVHPPNTPMISTWHQYAGRIR